MNVKINQLNDFRGSRKPKPKPKPKSKPKSKLKRKPNEKLISFVHWEAGLAKARDGGVSGRAYCDAIIRESLI